MNKTIISLFICVFLVTTLATVGMSKPVKDFYEVKITGKIGFTKIVDDNFPDNTITGWVKYSKRERNFQTTWSIQGLEPGEWYQLKLHSKNGDTKVGEACGVPNIGDIWGCGSWGDESFLVMATVQADEEGNISIGLIEKRLPPGYYKDMQFIVTQNSAPWYSAWTWENTPDTGDDPWNGDISTFKIHKQCPKCQQCQSSHNCGQKKYNCGK